MAESGAGGEEQVEPGVKGLKVGLEKVETGRKD